MNNEMQEGINISEEAINTIVSTSAKEVEGVKGIYSQVESSIKSMFAKKKVLNNGISYEIFEDGSINVDVAITVEYGYELKEVGANVQTKVKNAIEDMTSFNCTKVNVKVANVKDAKKEN
ncbi:MAG: Asp23/Gls24 family envelope stress response protein [Clostridia bacterium]|nr:Asp23/Gls24 family envelope stress response protein [Clostridia bacterium]